MTDTLQRRPRSGRRFWYIAGGTGVLAIAAFVAVYLLFFTGDSPPPLHLSTPSTAGSAAPATTVAGQTATTKLAASGDPASFDGTWTVGSSSTAGYRVRERLASLPAQSDAVGRTGAITGSINVASQDGGVVVAPGAKFQVDVTKLQSNESMRDNRIRSMGLESSRYPTASFASASPITVPAGSATGAAVDTQVSGDLTIHGVTKRVTIPVQAQINGGRIEVVGSLSFPFSDFGMTPPSIGGFVSVENTATLEFQLFFDRA